MRKGKFILITVVCLTVLLALLVGACGQPTQPAGGKPLKVGITTPTTGPAAEKGSPMGHANLDAIEYINKELGGASGHPIEVVWLDSKYDATQTVNNVKKFMDEGCIMFGTSSSTEMGFVKEIANRAEFPGLTCFNSPSLHRPPQHIYGQTPDYGDDWIAFANFYMKNIWKGSGKPKMAMHLLNNLTGYGARDAAKALADKLGIEIVSIDEHAATTISEMESLTRIKALKPDVLYIASTPKPTAVIMKNAVDLGLYPGITIGLGHAGITKALIDIAGADIVEGAYGTFPTVMWTENVAGMAKMTEYVRKLHDKDEGNMDYITAWAQSLIMAEILKVAVKNAGYDVLAKGDIKSWRAVETQGIQKLNNYDIGGLQGAVSYTPGDNRLTKFNRIYKIVNGQIANPSAWIEAPLVKYEEFDWFGK